jgi:hypothetical protein
MADRDAAGYTSLKDRIRPYFNRGLSPGLAAYELGIDKNVVYQIYHRLRHPQRVREYHQEYYRRKRCLVSSSSQ